MISNQGNLTFSLFACGNNRHLEVYFLLLPIIEKKSLLVSFNMQIIISQNLNLIQMKYAEPANYILKL